MTDSFRVAIVATAEDTTAPRDQTIEAFEANLMPHMPVMRAAHIDDVDGCLKTFWHHPHRQGRRLSLTLCGHGSSGVLHLGSSWMQPGGSVPFKAYQDPYYLLDTNPWALGRLGDHRDRFDQITLVGCYVGAVEAEGYAINGRTLAYTLCEHLRTKVVAAMDWVDPDELVTGEYVPDDHLQPSSWEWRSDGEPVYMPPPNGTEHNLSAAGESNPFSITSIVGTRVPARRSGSLANAIELTTTILQDRRLAFATPELLVNVREGETERSGAVYANGRVLRVGEKFYRVDKYLDASRKIAAALAL